MARIIVYTDPIRPDESLYVGISQDCHLVLECENSAGDRVPIMLSIEDAEQLINDLVSMTERIKAIKSQEK